MPLAFARPLAFASLACAFVACIPDASSTGSSSSSAAGGGGVSTDGGSGGDAADGVSANRQALCAAYAQSTVTCCAQGTIPCSSSNAADYNNYCLKYAKTCAGMPTCFSGTDCNTLIYCAGSC